MYNLANRACFFVGISRNIAISRIPFTRLPTCLCIRQPEISHGNDTFNSSFHSKVSNPISLGLLRKIIITNKRRRKRKELQKLKPKPKKPTIQGPAIIKMMLKANDSEIQKDVEGSDDPYLSKEALEKRIQQIKLDLQAIKQEKLNLENVDFEDVQDEEHIEDPNIPEKDSEYIESITLDVNQSKPKQKIKRFKLWGNPDPYVPITDIPCVGCGAKLHCADTAVPGYMPSEKFKTLTKEQLKKAVCQRCYLMEHHHMCLNLKASEGEFKEIISRIKNERALILVLIDLTDIENSILKGVTEVLGRNRPLVIIGNKIDLIPIDKQGHLERIKEELRNACDRAGLVNKIGSNIKKIHLMSAKTGHGVESLVTTLMSQWKLQGNVYVVGNTNTGKSTFFNTLVMSDYCKASVREAIHRATVSVWPGTTLSLLKFPIVNPTRWRLAKRNQRIFQQREEFQEQQMLRKEEIKKGGTKMWEKASLEGFVGVTDFRGIEAIQQEKDELNAIEAYELPSFEFINGRISLGKRFAGEEKQEETIKYDDTMFKMSRWFYDTPGVINNEQIINMLEQKELLHVLPKTVIKPRIFVVKPGQVVFVSGLGRIDYIEGNRTMYMNIFANKDLKVHILNGCEADDFYKENIGTEVFGIPLGDQERLDKIPALIGKQFDVVGIDWQTALADIQLSSLGWFSMTLGREIKASVRVYTPGGRGIYIRQPSLLPNIVTFQGYRIKGSPRYLTKKPLML